MNPQILEQFTTEQILTHLKRRNEAIYVMDLLPIPSSMRARQVANLKIVENALITDYTFNVERDSIGVTFNGRILKSEKYFEDAKMLGLGSTEYNFRGGLYEQKP